MYPFKTVPLFLRVVKISPIHAEVNYRKQTSSSLSIYIKKALKLIKTPLTVWT